MNNSQEHEYVDLGLPSGTLWATCNVGASNPEDNGGYFAWDECKTAAANWGNGWDMPSKEQWEELKENTKSSWATRNGVNGRLFTASNGNSLFLPAAGCRGRSSLYNAGSRGNYWSRSLYTGNPNDAWGLGFTSDGCYMSGIFGRITGRSVRPVRSAQLDMNCCPEHEHVDLGLPSGTLWATCNVGASNPEDNGGYFAWDECKTAAANWGNGWDMPSKEQWEELKENTKSSWATRNGVDGRLFTASNGNSLFLPAAGCRNDGSLYLAGSFGYYWSSSFYTDTPYYA